jgi:hypothetical protein
MFVINFLRFLATVSAKLRLSPLGLVLAVLMLMVAPKNASGQSEADRATARNLAAEGYTALKTQDYTTAEDRFRRADALVHAPTLVVDHARALIGLGRYVEAQERLELVLREGVPDSAPWVWKKSIQDASQLVNEVKPKVCWLTIYVKGSDDPVVTVDGVSVPVAALGVRRATDPGPRRISATAPGLLPKELTLALPEGSERAVTLELSPDPGAIRPAVVESQKQHKPRVRRRNPPEPKSNTLAYGAIGLGGVGVLVGAVTGAMFLSVRSDLTKACPNRKCPDTYVEFKEKRSDYRTYGTISAISWTVGLVSSIAGTWMLLSDEPKEKVVRARQARVTPYITNDSLGILGEF